jgi:hypothetical protein
MKVRVALALPDETFKAIAKQAAKEGTTISEFFEAAVLQHFRTTGASQRLTTVSASTRRTRASDQTLDDR